MKSFLAFILSPVVSVFTVHVVITIFFTISADGTINTFLRFIQFGLIVYLLLYVIILLISIPVFLTIRYFFGWHFRSCILGAALVFVIIGVLLLTGENKFEHNDIEYLSSVKILFAWIFGAIVYGSVFWLIVNKKRGQIYFSTTK